MFDCSNEVTGMSNCHAMPQRTMHTINGQLMGMAHNITLTPASSCTEQQEGSCLNM